MGLGFGVGWEPLLGTSKFISEGKRIGVNKHQTANPDRMNDADGWVRRGELTAHFWNTERRRKSVDGGNSKGNHSPEETTARLGDASGGGGQQTALPVEFGTGSGLDT